MRRSVSALFVAAVAMLLSLVLAVPASAADPVGPDPRFKYGLDYYYRELFDPGNTKGWKSINVSGDLNPSKTGGSWYLQNQQNAAGTRSLNPANKPISGKIITPGKTVVRAPSTYATAPKFLAAGTPGWSKLLGSAGIGIGGQSVAPTNSSEIALSQGVSQGCLDGTACTADEVRKRFSIDSCSHTGTCQSIGAEGIEGMSDPFTDFFKRDALPFLEDVWASITGQNKDGEPLPDAADSNGAYTFASTGCTRFVPQMQFRDGNNVTMTLSAKNVVARESLGLFARETWDSKCAPAVQTNVNNMEHSMWRTACVDIPTGRTKRADGTGFGKSGTFISGTWQNNPANPALKDNAVGMCADPQPNSAEQFALVKIQIFHGQPASQGTFYHTEYSEWHNLLPIASGVDFIEDTKITTTVTCQTPDGQTFTTSESISKTAAFVAPSCPPGSDLVSHEVKSEIAAGNTNVIDAGAAVPGAAAAYPECFGASGGCTMQVHLDGSACVSTRLECSTWPAIASNQPSRVDCKWGTYSVPVSDCYALSNAYKSEVGVVFDPSSGAWIAVDIYGNPIAPNPEPWNPTNPNPAVGQNPGTTPGTGTGTQTPGFPTTGTTPGAAGCNSPSWSWNPMDWVHSPALCALQDAFIPKTDVTARVNELKDLAVDKPPLNWISPPVTGPSASGCPNWVVSVPGFSKNVVCESSFTSAILSARPALFGLVATAMVWPFFRSLWYAAIPILRVSPGSSK